MSVTAALLLATVALLPAGASAYAQSTRYAADRLRITAEHEQLSPDAGAVATATGTVAPPAQDTTLPLVVSTGRVLLTALPRTRHCPRNAPRPDPPYSTDYYFNETQFSQVLAIPRASEVARKLRLCGYLTARRRTPSGVRTVTVARASTTVSGPDQHNSSEEPAWAYRVVGGIFAVTLLFGLIFGLIVGLVRLGRWWIRDTPAARAARRAATARRLRLRLRSPTPPPAPPPEPPPAPPEPPPAPPPEPPPARPAPSDADPATPPPPSAARDAPPQPSPVQNARPRRRAKPRDVVLGAADAVADAYRDRLQNILEHQDGPGWLEAFNDRRAARLVRDGKPVPRPYDSLEPRAVLTCLGRDPAGEQLISGPAAGKARELSGLVNKAVHPRPHAPLTEADGYRAWRLYTDVTGIVPAGDPFER